MPSPRKRAAKGDDETSKLLNALNVIARAQDKTGHVGEQHCRIRNGWIIGTNGKLSIGLKINNLFEANPNTEELMLALSKCGEQVVFTPDAKSQTLHVKSGRFQVTIGTVADTYVPTVVPDLPVAKIDEKLLEALTVCSAVIDETQDNPMLKGVWLDGYSCAASDRYSIIQFWHGIHLPEGLIIPKFAIKALNEHEGKLVQFGFSQGTATFYFDDDAFVQTVLYDSRYPNYKQVLDKSYSFQDIPNGFFDGLKSIVEFSKDKTVYFHEGKLTTTYEDNGKGAVYEVKGLSKGRIFNGERLRLLEKYANKVDFYSETGAAFVGDRCRGIIARRS